MIVVKHYPPNDYCNSLVNLESLYGICGYPVESALITIPRVNNDLFIFWASFKRTPTAFVFAIFSEPAKSIMFKIAYF